MIEQITLEHKWLGANISSSDMLKVLEAASHGDLLICPCHEGRSSQKDQGFRLQGDTYIKCGLEIGVQKNILPTG